jgi:hypothetical protein
MNGNFWKDAYLTQYEVVSRSVLAGREETHEKFHSE